MEEVLSFLQKIVSVPIAIGVIASIEFIKKNGSGWVQKHPNTMSMVTTVLFVVAACLAGLIKWEESLLQALLVYFLANLFYSNIFKRIRDFIKTKKGQTGAEK